jgi:hypothetical protein
MELPGVESPQWPDHVVKRFKKYVDTSNKYEYPERDWIYIEINGTTFSGEWSTTAYNTLR